MMPTVRSVIAASTRGGSRQKSSASMSAKTGVAPVRATELAVAAKVNDGHDDLVARPDPAREEAEVQARGAGVDRDAGAAEPEVLGELLLERRDLGPLREHAGAQHAVDRLALLVSDDRLGRGDEVVHSLASVEGLVVLVVDGRRSGGTPSSPSARRSRGTPARPTQRMRRAGTPATRAKSGTSLGDDRPGGDEGPATDRHRCDADRAGPDRRALADRSPRRRPSRRRASASRPGMTARGKWSLVRTTAGPMKTPASRTAGS